MPPLLAHPTWPSHIGVNILLAKVVVTLFTTAHLHVIQFENREIENIVKREVICFVLFEFPPLISSLRSYLAQV